MDIARLYRTAQASFVEFANTLSDDEWRQPSPCTPGWSARDLLSHAAGVSIDIVEGNVEGAATEPWTAAQVERWRTTPVDEMIRRWNDAIGPAATAIESVGEQRPIFDCHSHEHDLRCAVGRPGNRETALMAWITGQFVDVELPQPVRYQFADGTEATTPGNGEPISLAGITPFDLFRARLGRRSASQVRAWTWSEPPSDDLLAAWFAFGPTPTDIVE